MTSTSGQGVTATDEDKPSTDQELWQESMHSSLLKGNLELMQCYDESYTITSKLILDCLWRCGAGEPALGALL